MTKKVWMGVLGVVLVLIIGWLVFKPNNGQSKTTMDTLYDFMPVQRVDLSEKVDATGTVVLSKNSDIYPAFEATVSKIHCKAGDYVKKGQLLLTLDSPQMAESLIDATASVSQAQINLNVAKRDLANTKALLEVQGATIAQVDDAQDKVNTCEQQLESARLKLENLTQKPDEANFIAPNRRDLLIRAPFDGVVAWINVVTGAHVLTSNIILSVAADNSLEVKASVDESEIELVKPGQTAEITGSDPNQPTLRGVVTEVGAIGTAESGVVNFPVHAKITGNSKTLKPGMSVDITFIASEHSNVLTVPFNAIVRRRGKTMVALKTKDSVSFVRVVTGVQTGSNIEIVSGLNEGDMVGIERPKINSQNSNNNRDGGGMRFRFGGGRR